MNEKVLVADDERSIASLLAYALRKEGYTVEEAYEGEEALSKIKTFKPRIVILDVMMPKLSGFDVCKKLDDKNNMGIIMLTAKNDIVDKILGLELGADDYISKPFDIREILARVRSLVRRLGKVEEENDVIQIKDIKLLLNQRKVILENKEIELTPKEYELLAQLLNNINRVYSREELLDLIWGMDYFGGTRTVDIHIQRLRKKLGESHQYILQTVYKVGYKAIGEVYED